MVINDYQVLALFLLGAVLIGMLLRETRRRRLGQQRLEERLRFEQLVAELSSTFINLPVEKIEGRIIDALGRVASLLRFDIAALSVFTDPGPTGRVAHVWRAEGVPEIPSDLTDRDFPWVAQELFGGRDVSLRALDLLPPEAHVDRATYEQYHVRSTFNVPMFSGGKVIGVLGLCTVWEEREMSRELMQAQRLLGEIFANALARARAEMELREQRQELAHLSRVSTMSELAASLTHELNQPLTAILSNAQAAQRFLAAEPADLQEAQESLKDIVQDTNRAGDVIHRMRGLVKKGELDTERLDIAGVINDVVLLIHADATLQNVRISSQINPNLRLVRGDRIQLQQVLLNLLLNAFEAMRDCPVSEREVKVWTELQDRRLLRVAVRDYGTGLNGDHLDRIFQPFYTTKPEGLGMGLSICRSIIAAHGGQLWAENNFDRGATFYFTVPVEETDEGGVSRVEERGARD